MLVQTPLTFFRSSICAWWKGWPRCARHRFSIQRIFDKFVAAEELLSGQFPVFSSSACAHMYVTLTYVLLKTRWLTLCYFSLFGMKVIFGKCNQSWISGGLKWKSSNFWKKKTKQNGNFAVWLCWKPKWSLWSGALSLCCIRTYNINTGSTDCAWWRRIQSAIASFDWTFSAMQGSKQVPTFFATVRQFGESHVFATTQTDYD